MTKMKAGDLRLGDIVRLVSGGLWYNSIHGLTVEITKFNERHQPMFLYPLDQAYYYVDDEDYPFEFVSHGKPSEKDIVFRSELGRRRYGTLWTSKLHDEMVAQTKEKAESYVRYHYRDWPYDKNLDYLVDDTTDEITFYWVSK